MSYHHFKTPPCIYISVRHALDTAELEDPSPNPSPELSHSDLPMVRISDHGPLADRSCFLIGLSPESSSLIFNWINSNSRLQRIADI